MSSFSIVTYSFDTKTGGGKTPSRNHRQRLDRLTPQHGTTWHFTWFAYQVACAISSLVSVEKMYLQPP